MKRTKREHEAGQIAEFQLIVRRYAKAEEPTIELPTELLVPIADALDYVRPPAGRPKRTRRQIIDEAVGLSWGRLRLAELKKELPARQALERAAIDLKRENKHFEELSLKTIEDRLQRNRRRRSKAPTGK